MSVQISSSTYCWCGGDIKVTSSSWQAVQDMLAAFEQFHSGDGHRLFATSNEAKKARREAPAAEEAECPTESSKDP